MSDESAVIALGIDPGQTGAAAIVDGEDVLWWCRWRPRRAKGYLYDTRDTQRAPVETMHLIGREIASAAYLLDVTRGACEGQAVAGRVGVQSVLTLARSAGIVAGPSTAVVPDWTWPTSREWRRHYGTSTWRAGEAKGSAVQWVADHYRIDATPDLAEAVQIAHYRRTR